MIPRNPTRSRGIALIVVMWMLALLTIIIGTFAVLARTEVLQSRFLFDTTDARYAAEAGLHRAVVELRNPDVETRWVADGRPYEFRFGDADVEVRITDETGLIDVNATAQGNPELLIRLFESVGLNAEDAELMTAAIQDWIDADEETRVMGAEDPEYANEGLPYGPANQPFGTVEELQQVIGMSWNLFRSVADSVTVHSGRADFNPAFAPLGVLQTIPDMDEESAQLFMEERSQYHPADQMQLVLPDGTMVNQRGSGLTHTVVSRATLDSGTWNEIEATIRLGTDSRGRPFRIVRWKQNRTESN
ncbi:MAG: general secretion pathway protein GspK [Wenzhouxiangellaceae bacterium]|nr:general secretion pathway protein GspK [Wenzhouxiangellaceae bacterium]MBS3824311.1 general secretion pathway protein GspK [Wenzhouxiangellaceae bacterium]